MRASDTHSAIDAVWRIESARLIAGLARIVRDISAAEDLAQDAPVAALEQWPEAGIPANPGAWLMTTAKRRGIDAVRRRATLERKRELIGRDRQVLQELNETGLSAQVDEVEDDVLRLVLHDVPSDPLAGRPRCIDAAPPRRTVDARDRSRLPRLGGDCGAAHRARQAHAHRGPGAVRGSGTSELADRLSAVLEVIYLIFNEGYAATFGEHWTRPVLCQDAMRLGRILAGLLRREPEVHGLLALMELQASRLRARIGPHGEPVLLDDQDRARWDHLLVQRGLAALERAENLSRGLGPYTLQAAIAACHARAHSPEQTDWPRIVALYDALAALTGSPVVELNRAVAVTRAFGPEAGLELVDSLADEPGLRRYPLLASVRGDVLARLGRLDEARAEFARAADLCDNDRERELLLSRAVRSGSEGPAP